MDVGETLRTKCARIIEAECAVSCAWTDADKEDRQLRLREAELAARLRFAFESPDAFLYAQGKNSERDIVLYGEKAEIEVKYFCSMKANGTPQPQGGNVPLSDWRWLVGKEHREPIRSGYARYSVVFFPTASTDAGVQNTKTVRIPGRWRFQDCLSFAPADGGVFGPTEFLPFFPCVEVCRPSEKAKQRLRFVGSPNAKSILQGSPLVRCDVIGEPTASLVWALVFEIHAGPVLPAGYASLG